MTGTAQLVPAAGNAVRDSLPFDHNSVIHRQDKEISVEFGPFIILAITGFGGSLDMSRKLHFGTILLAAAALAVAIAWACLHRGPWYDEFYTQYVTRPGPGWTEALRKSWLADNHPPLYYALARASDGLGRIETHRLLNLAIGACGLLAGAAIVRDVPRLLPAGAALLLLLAGNEWTVLSGSELRSYFLSLCAGALLAFSLAALALTREGGSIPRRLAYGAAVLIGFNTHIVTTLIAGSLILPFLLIAALQRDWSYFRALLLPPLASGLLFVAVSLVQLPHWQANTQNFWIEGGLASARWSIEYALLRCLEANPLVLAGAIAGVAIMGRDLMRDRAACEGIAILAQLSAGVVLGLALLTAIHLVHPLLIEKYLTAMVGAVSLGMALACGRLLRALGPAAGAMFLGAALLLSLWSLCDHVARTTARNSWYGTGRYVADIRATCPDTLVHVDRFWNADVMAMSPADNLAVAPAAYRTVAAHFGFALEPETSRRMAKACPTLFWAEHDTRHRFTDAAILAHLRASGFAVNAITVRRIGDGWVAMAAARPEQ